MSINYKQEILSRMYYIWSCYYISFFILYGILYFRYGISFKPFHFFVILGPISLIKALFLLKEVKLLKGFWKKYLGIFIALVLAVFSVVSMIVTPWSKLSYEDAFTKVVNSYSGEINEGVIFLEKVSQYDKELSKLTKNFESSYQYQDVGFFKRSLFNRSSFIENNTYTLDTIEFLAADWYGAKSDFDRAWLQFKSAYLKFYAGNKYIIENSDYSDLNDAEARIKLLALDINNLIDDEFELNLPNSVEEKTILSVIIFIFNLCLFFLFVTSVLIIFWRLFNKTFLPDIPKRMLEE